MQSSSLKPELHHLIDLAHERQRAQIATVSQDEHDAAGTPERWSAKDHLAHTAFWKEYLIEVLATVERGETPTRITEFQPVNEANFQAFRDRSWADVLASDARSHALVHERLDALSDDDLVDPTRFAWRNGDPLIYLVLGNTYWHAQEHLAQYLADRGDLDGATRVHETFVQELLRAGLPSAVQGEALYNFACFYATTGRTAQALATLAEALRLNPKLTEWSKEDPDFTSLRGEPEYQALYGV